jgi:hypothetical protein
MPTAVVALTTVRPVPVSSGGSGVTNHSTHSTSLSKEEGYIIGGCVGGGIVGVFLLVILCCFCCRYKRKYQEVTFLRVRQNRLQQIETQISAFLDTHPYVLDMDDVKIPSYLKKHIPELSDTGANDALYIVARRRIAPPSIQAFEQV